MTPELKQAIIKFNLKFQTIKAEFKDSKVELVARDNLRNKLMTPADFIAKHGHRWPELDLLAKKKLEEVL